jgi:hypothetical protein
MDRIFVHSAPCLNYELAKQNIKEFQILFNINNEFLESYYENNKKTFLECVYTYIRHNYINTIRKLGIGFHYDDNMRYPHIYVHLDLNDNTNKVIQKIVDDLENQYRTNWIKFRIPKLMTLVKNQMKKDKSFQEALESYVTHHGKNDTDTLLHVYSNHIKWYYDDIAFCVKRNKYDFQ